MKGRSTSGRSGSAQGDDGGIRLPGIDRLGLAAVARLPLPWRHPTLFDGGSPRRGSIMVRPMGAHTEGALPVGGAVIAVFLGPVIDRHPGLADDFLSKNHGGCGTTA